MGVWLVNCRANIDRKLRNIRWMSSDSNSSMTVSIITL